MSVVIEEVSSSRYKADATITGLNVSLPFETNSLVYSLPNLVTNVVTAQTKEWPNNIGDLDQLFLSYKT